MTNYVFRWQNVNENGPLTTRPTHHRDIRDGHLETRGAAPRPVRGDPNEGGYLVLVVLPK